MYFNLMMSNNDEICILCSKKLSDGETVEVRRGLQTIVKSSIRRKDGICNIIRDLESITVHSDCRKSYTRESSILANNTQSPVKAKQLRSASVQFDFKSNCLFCENKCDTIAELRKPLSKRDIYEVRTKECKDSIIRQCAERNDELGHKVLVRVASVCDLVAAEARYHNSCYKLFFYVHTGMKRGRPENESISEAFNKLCSYLLSNDECQYGLTELVELMETYLPNETNICCEKTLKDKLKARFGDDVVITDLPGRGKKPVVCLRTTGHKIIDKAWYQQKCSDPDDERLRIVKAAAAIVRADICSSAYDTQFYLAPGHALSDATHIIPKTLNVFMEDVIVKGRKCKTDDLTKKAAVISHSIITAVRPKSFLSVFQIGLAVYIHRHVGSRHLIDLINAMGLCATYHEALRYESSAANSAEYKVAMDAFVQFVFDNADYNVRTLDGHNTFHGMGGVMCVTPCSALSTPKEFERLKQLPNGAQLSALHKLPIRSYSCGTHSGLKTITVQDLESIRILSPSNARLSVDVLWMVGSWLKAPDQPNWSGFMQLYSSCDTDISQAHVAILPFLRLNPSSLDAIYSVLLFSIDECKRHGQQTCIITFDQPLYAKATEMVAANRELLSVVIRLGGFHLLMSYLGSVGYIMGGSGLKELWTLIYGPESIDKMLTGHSYARSLRAHFLTQLALVIVLLSQVNCDNEICKRVLELHQSVIQNIHTDIGDNKDLQLVVDLIQTEFQRVAARSRTGKLWFQYFQQIQLARQFVRAERCGDWLLHLHTVREMLPHFHAAGHIPYAKSIHLYLQQMASLSDKLTSDEFSKFCLSGNFTVKRSNHRWAGVWTDMTIEQVLMRAIKTSGGLTRGRGFTDSILQRWTMGMPGCTELSNQLQQFFDVLYITSDQHVELRESRKCRDISDSEKLSDWLMAHPPFPHCPDLISVCSGITANELVNCDLAVEVGKKAISQIVGCSFADIHLRRKDKVVTLASVNQSIKIHDDVIPINTMQIFNRIVCVVNSEEELEQCLQYELAPVPLSLFDEFSMRKTQKAILYEIIEMETIPPEATYPHENDVFVVDGGFFLWQLIWPPSTTYSNLYTSYIDLLRRQYGDKNVIVVFDGYGNNQCTKGVERKRRAKKAQSADICFNDEMLTTVSQNQFLSNVKNKSRFIDGLIKKLRDSGITVHQSKGDADALIISTALNVPCEYNVIVVGTDVDLLVLMIQMGRSHHNLYFFKPGHGKVTNKTYNITEIVLKLGDMCRYILFLHAITGCDTTSAIYRQGKKKAFRVLKNSVHLQKCAATFNESTASKDMLVSAGEQFMLSLYSSAKSTTSLDKHWHLSYLKSVARSPIHKEMQLAALPPTLAAAQEHFYRVYHQIQSWLGNALPPEEWGWYVLNGDLLPTLTSKAAAPDKLLNLISCKCKTGCERACGCKKAGLHCTVLCSVCHGNGCSNSAPYLDDSDIDDIIENTVENDD